MRSCDSKASVAGSGTRACTSECSVAEMTTTVLRDELNVGWHSYGVWLPCGCVRRFSRCVASQASACAARGHPLGDATEVKVVAGVKVKVVAAGAAARHHLQ